MSGHGLLALAWVTSVVSFCFAAVAFWRLRRSLLRAGPAAWTAGGLLVLAWAVCSWGVLIEPELLAVRRVTVTSERWTGPPVRIGLISDTHSGAPHGGLSRLEGVVRRMNAERPDLVLLLGDYAGGHEPAARRKGPENSAVLGGVALFRKLKAPLGVAGVSGNHDYWYDKAAIQREMTAAGVRVLADSAVRIDRPGGAFWVAGLNSLDDAEAPPHVARALAAVPQGAPVILAMHEPDRFAQAPDSAALTVAGHTHCGQVKLPLVGRPVLPGPGSRRWPCHLYNQGGRQLYVTGGVGTSILPVRLGAPPEIVILTLRAPGS